MAILYHIMNSFDRIFVILKLGKKAMGFYTIAAMLRMFISFLPGLASEVLEPIVYHSYGESHSVDSINKFLYGPIIIIAFLGPYFLGLGYIISPVIIHKLLPKYTPSIIAIQILILGSFFSSIASPTRSFFIALRKQSIVMFFYIPAILTGAIFTWLGLQKYPNLIIVSIGFSISALTFALIALSYSFWLDKFSISMVILNFVEKLLPYIYSLFSLFLIELLLLKGFFITDSLLKKRIIYIGIYTITYIPIFLYFISKTKLFGLLKKYG